MVLGMRRLSRVEEEEDELTKGRTVWRDRGCWLDLDGRY